MKFGNQAGVPDSGREQGLAYKIFQFPLMLLIIGVAIQFAAIAAGSQIRVFIDPKDDSPALLLVVALVCAIALGAHRLFNLYVDRSPHNDVEGKGAVQETGAGIAFGFLLFSFITGIVWAVGGYEPGELIGWHTIWQMLATFALAPGVMEEILFRGLLFRYVERLTGSWIALAVSGALFGLAHYANPNGGVVPAVAIAIEAGIMLGAVYMLTRRLWAAIGVHMAWNFTQGWVFGLPVSGIDDPGLISAKLVGPDWLTGGAFGLEASVVAMVVATAAGLVLLKMAHKKGRFVAFPNWKTAWRSGWPQN
jgi:uncharacterized protein